jgi:hypothetical protein
VSIDAEGDFLPCGPRPDGYLAAHAWAQVQLRAGRKEVRCMSCSLWHFDFEMDDEIHVSHASASKFGEPNVTVRSQRCKPCAQKAVQS